MDHRIVEVLIGHKLEFKLIDTIIDNEGRLIILNCEIQGNNCLLINSYFPNIEKEQISLLKSILEKVQSLDLPTDSTIIWGGDFNFVSDLYLESSGGNPKIKIGSVEQLQSILQDLDICDIWRIRNPLTKRFTWRGSAQGLVSSNLETL